MNTCPTCATRLESTAIVAAFNDPPGWAFWGQEGGRWIVCQGAGFVHFRVRVDGRTYHRLARIATEPIAAPVLESGQIAQPLPLFAQAARRQGDDWL
jgi:hypothetical protein